MVHTTRTREFGPVDTFVRSAGTIYVADATPLEGGQSERGGLANGSFKRGGVVFWGAGPDVDCAIGQTPSRRSTSAATATAATPPPLPPPRVSIFPRSLRDRNTPVHVSS